MDPDDKKKLRSNTVLLTRDLIVDEMFLAVLLQRNTLSYSMKEDITCHRKKTDKNSEFLSILPRRGPNAFNDFIVALLETRQDHLAEALSPELVAQWKKANPYGPSSGAEMGGGDNGFYQPGNFTAPHPGSFVPAPAVDKESDPFITINLQPVNPLLRNQVLRNEHLYYKMSAKPRGQVIILNNEIFDQTDKAEKKLSEREGSYFDVVNLTELFEALGFKTELWSNCTAKEIRKKINEERRQEAHKAADAFVFIALSHGAKGAIYGTDGGQVEIEKEIIDSFDGNNCPQLVGKPKLFFIQACQGDKITMGNIKADSDEQGDAQMEKMEDQKDAIPTEGSLIHEKADVLVFYSTVPGYKSWRNTELGSWFMRDLVINMNQYAHIKQITEILTMVNNQLSERQVKMRGFKQISEYKSTLRKDLYFLPRS